METLTNKWSLFLKGHYLGTYYRIAGNFVIIKFWKKLSVADLEGLLWFLQKPPFETRRNPSG